MTIDTGAGIVVRKRAGWVPDPRVSVQVIRELTLAYHSPVLGVGDVDVRLWIERAGRTSVTYRVRGALPRQSRALRRGPPDRCELHPRTMRPSRFPDDMWEMAAPLLDDNVARTA